jgi:hypothetical protein
VRPALRKLLVAALPATLVAAVLAAALVEVWVRLRWDERRGTPGFYLSDPVLGQRLAPGYAGWFAGVPVRINTLGFRDPRDYALAKAPATFRIIVLGDSVTFGHGSIWENTYPFLAEQQLKAWRPDVEWQVWNLGVPGYNTSTELAYLEDIGVRYQPDLVIVGFYPNDFTGNTDSQSPSFRARTVSGAQRLMQRNLYSFEFYKRALLTLRWRLFTSDADRARLEALAGDEALLGYRPDAAEQPDQQLTAPEYFDDQQVASFVCKNQKAIDPANPPPDLVRRRLQQDEPEMRAWRRAVERFQELHRSGSHRVMFFINLAPQPCPEDDRFSDPAGQDDDQALRAVLGGVTPVASSFGEFMHYRPSQMPAASGHSYGNSNKVKADALVRALRAEVLPPLLESRAR